jgi:hypothetical protein
MKRLILAGSLLLIFFVTMLSKSASSQDANNQFVRAWRAGMAGRGRSGWKNLARELCFSACARWKRFARAFEFSGRRMIVKSTRPEEHWRVAWEHY